MGAKKEGALDRVTGVGTALVTPFTDDGVDLDALSRLVEAQIEAGVDFLVPCGTTGESPTLTDEERTAVIERTVDAAAGRVAVVAGTGTNDTAHSVAMTKAARAAGADACLAVAPYYNRPTQEGLYRHFRSMIDDGGLPAVLYHIPGRTGVSIEPDTILRTHEGGGVVGLKETETVARVTRIRELCDVSVLSGDDGLTLPMMALGAEGVVSVASNVVPAEIGELVRHARHGRFREALVVHVRLAALFRALFLEPNPQPVKAALLLRGMLPSDVLRLPLVPAGERTRAALEEALAPFAARTPA
jgi:4-hydroxy-tetrahydrodipicolinate synthase